MEKRVILASASPRREKLLKKIKENFEIIVSDVDENNFEFTDVFDYVKKCALYKAKEVYNNVNDENCLVIGADTVIVCDGKILGKPKDENDAFNILKCLSDKKISVVTGYSVILKDKEYNEHKDVEVKFGKISDEEINEYIETKEPLDKAGAFAIQGIGMKYIDSLTGDYSVIVGLPVRDIYLILKENGFI